MFTREQIEEIRSKLQLNSMKDTQMNNSSLPLIGNEVISFVQNGINVKMNLIDLVNNLLLFRASDFINISETFKDKFSLEEAVKHVAPVNRKTGMVITYIDRELNDWVIFQYKGQTKETWLSTAYWKSLLDENRFKGYFNTEAQLVSLIASPNRGDYAFVGITLSNSVIYKCTSKSLWTATTEPARDYVKVILDGNITIGSNGNWFQDGIDTGIKVQGPKGDPGINPILRSANGYIQYSYDNVTWMNILPASELDYINAPDNEDITEDGSKRLQFADKVYSSVLFTGLGRKYLRKNIINNAQTASPLSESISGDVPTINEEIKDPYNYLAQSELNQESTIYIIQYNYSLNGETIVVPANSILMFQGGSISNGTIQGNNTMIVAEKGNKIFPYNLLITGTWNVDKAYSSWFNPKMDGYKITELKRVETKIAEILATKKRTTTVTETNVTTRTTSAPTVTTVDDATIAQDSTNTIYTYFYKIEGKTEWIPEKTIPAGTYTDDAVKLRQLFLLKADETQIEKGNYMVSLTDEYYTYTGGMAVFNIIDFHNKKIIIDGNLKCITSNYINCFMFNVINCSHLTIEGSGMLQGDIVENNLNEAPWCIGIIVRNTSYFHVSDLSIFYMKGIGIKSDFSTEGAHIEMNTSQHHHTYDNLNIRYVHDHGIQYVLGDNVIVKNCNISDIGTWKINRYSTAINVEPFSDTTVYKRYCENFDIYNNNILYISYGLVLRRCFNTDIYSNKISDTVKGIRIPELEKSSEHVINYYIDNKYVKGNCNIYNNYIYNCTDSAIDIGELRNTATANIHDNFILNGGCFNLTCAKNTYIYSNKILNCNIINGATVNKVYIYDNLFDGVKPNKDNISLGYPYIMMLLWGYGIDNLQIFNNKFYANPNIIPTVTIVGKDVLWSSQNTKPLMLTGEFINDTIQFKDNYIDYNLALGNSGNDTNMYGHIPMHNTVNENSYIFFKDDIFKSKYGQTGKVTSNGYLKTGGIAFRPQLEVKAGMCMHNNDNTRTFMAANDGTLGDTFPSGFEVCGNVIVHEIIGLTMPVISWETTGTCTRDTRPTTFNSKGRRLLETDTNLLIEYDGSKFVVINNNYVGNTASRPSLSTDDHGVEYFDTDLLKPIYWKSIAWYDSAGALQAGNPK